MEPGILLLIVALICMVVIIGLLIALLRRVASSERAVLALQRASARSAQSSPTAGTDPERISAIAIVMNPSKHDDPEAFRSRVRAYIQTLEGAEVRFYDTSVEDPGYGQAKQAVAEGAEIVIAAGGDGTVRSVAAALTDTGTRMAIMPEGTGNLLARNLDVPLDDIDGALHVALEGVDKRIDVGWLQGGTSAQDAEIAPREIFLVMAGIGADAEIIGATDPKLKKRIGWIAYVLAGANKVVGHSHEMIIDMPGGDRHRVKARTVLIGNVGKLPGGIVLMPSAAIDNRKLEVLALGWRGAAGLSQILTQVVNPRLKARPALSTMESYMTTSVRIESAKELPVQLDGDTETDATHLIARVDPAALTVRVPRVDA